jgi:hypothetical protein
MSILPKLATSLQIRDTAPNVDLAKIIISKNDKNAIRELVENLSNKNKNIQSDCIKVLYEIGERKPELIAAYDKEFLSLLNDKNNRLVWGAMTALDCITSINPKGIYSHLTKILVVAEKGSVITKDHGVNILIKLAALKPYTENCLTLLLEQFKTSLPNQLPKYAEDALPVITDKYKAAFSKILASRLKDVEKNTKKNRIEKVIKKLA